MQRTRRNRPAAAAECAPSSGPGGRLFGRVLWHRALRLPALLGLLIAVLVPAGADAAFTAPFFYSPAAQSSTQHDVALDASGDAVAVWERFDGANDRVEARARSAAGVLGTVQTLSVAGQDASFPKVAVDAGGDAVVVWARKDGSGPCGSGGCVRIQARARSAAGVLGPVLTLSPPGQNAHEFDVALDADGDAVAVWNRSDGTSGSCCRRIQARPISAGGVLGPVQVLSAGSQNADTPKVAVDADGDAVVVWQRFDGTSVRIQARARSAGGTLGAVLILSPAGHSASAPRVAVDSVGDALVVWQRPDGTGPCGINGCPKIQGIARSAGGTLGPVLTLSNTPRGGSSPEVAVDADGDALVVWEHLDATTNCFGGGCDVIQARARSAGGALGAVLTLSTSGQDAGFPQIGIDSDGDAVAAWQRFDGTNFRAQARTRAAGGALGPVQTPSPAGHNIVDPQVDAAAGGTTLASWERSDGLGQCFGGSSCNRVEAAKGP